MGYVPAGPVPAEGQDHELPGRQHRRARARHRALTNRRVARLGEALAAAFLSNRGAQIVARNVRSGRGEIDILARFPDVLAAVEVKTRVGPHDPRQAFTAEKARHVRATAAGLRPRPGRVDLIAVRLTAAGVEIRWIPAA